MLPAAACVGSVGTCAGCFSTRSQLVGDAQKRRGEHAHALHPRGTNDSHAGVVLVALVAGGWWLVVVVMVVVW
jgi:hypothetical protein